MQNDERITGKIDLVIAGKMLEMKISVPAKPVKPQRVLPVFQQLAGVFVDISVQSAEEKGEKISCKAGCGACCRQTVPLAEIEIYQIAALVESMPEPRRSEIKKRFADGCEHFHKINWFERMEDCAATKQTGSVEESQKKLADTALEYFYQGIPCPFLENESCSIHEVRPLVCREYLVTSPAENCSQPSAATINKLELLAKPSKSLMATAQTEVAKKLGFVPMIRALELAEQFPEEFPERSGDRWMAEFFKHLTKTEIPEEGIRNEPKSNSTKRAKNRKI